MNVILSITRSFAVALVLVLTATGLWAAGAEEEPAAAADKKYVTDPTTGKAVTAPEYGGTLTYPYVLIGETTDPFVTGPYAGMLIAGVNENLAVPNWALDRKEFAFNGPYFPLFTWTGQLAESWETPDATTIRFQHPQGRLLA